LDYVQANPALEWHCLNLTEIYRKRRRLLADVGPWRLYRAYYFPILTSGLLWSRPGAVSFLQHVRDRGIFLPVDQQLRFHLAETGMGLSLDRPAIRLVHYVSTIQLSSDVLKRHHLSRLLRNVHNYWYAFWARI
jgi:glycosyl transferase family 25